MRSRLAVASPWISAVLSGLVFAIYLAGFTVAFDHASVRRAVVEAAIVVPLWTVYMRWVNRGEAKRIALAVDGLDKADRVRVLEAARTGSPPVDPALRVRAVQLLEQRIATHQRQRYPSLFVLGLFVVLAIGLAVASTWWWLVAAAVFGAVFGWALRYADSQHRRLTTLSGPPLQSPTPAS